MPTINYRLSPANNEKLYFIVQRRTGDIHESTYPATGIFRPFTDRSEAEAYAEKIKNNRAVYYVIDRRSGKIQISDRKKAGPYSARLSLAAARRVSVAVKRRNLKRRMDEYNAALDEYLAEGGTNPDGFSRIEWNI